MEALVESQNEKQHPQNMQEAMAMDDAQTCRIECGCGCHQHMDSLPHLLSPHLISQVAGIPANPAFERAENLIYSFFSYTPSVQLPPPNVS